MLFLAMSCPDVLITYLPAFAQAATALPVLEERRREVASQLGQQLGRLGQGFVASTHDLFEQVPQRPARPRACSLSGCESVLRAVLWGPTPPHQR